MSEFALPQYVSGKMVLLSEFVIFPPTENYNERDRKSGSKPLFFFSSLGQGRHGGLSHKVLSSVGGRDGFSVSTALFLFFNGITRIYRITINSPG